MAINFGSTNTKDRFVSHANLGDEFNVVEFTYLVLLQLPDGTLGSVNRVLGQAKDGSTNGDLLCSVAATNKPTMQIAKTSGDVIATTFGTVVKDTWHLLAFSRNASGNATVTMNDALGGIVFRGDAGTSTDKLPKEKLVIGNFLNADSNDAFKGYIAWVAFFNRALSDWELSEIALTNKVVGIDIDNLVELWNFDELANEIEGEILGVKLDKNDTVWGADVDELPLPIIREDDDDYIPVGIEFTEFQDGTASVAEAKGIQLAVLNLKLKLADLYSGQAGNYQDLFNDANKKFYGRFSFAEIDAAVTGAVEAIRNARKISKT